MRAANRLERFAGWAMLAPAGAGLSVGDVVLVVVRSLRRGRTRQHPAPPAG